MKRGDSLVLRPSGDVLQDTTTKHSAQAFRIPQTLSEQSSKNFGIWQSKQIVLLKPGCAEVGGGSALTMQVRHVRH